MKFILTGTYSSFNKGDAAMQLATASALSERWPDSLITVSTPFPEYDRDIYSDYTIVRSTRRRLIFASFLLLGCHIYRLFLKFGIRINFLLKNDEVKSIKQADILVDLSGDTITEDYGPHVTYSHLLPMLMAQALGTKTYICGQSMGPFKLTRWLAVYTLKRCAGVTAREKITFDYLKSLGIPREKLTLESDMAFLLKPTTRAHVKKILEKEKIVTSRPILGITVSNIIRNRFNKKSDEAFDSYFASAIDSIIEKLDVSVLFIGHVTGPSKSKDDRLVAQEVMQHMRHDNKTFILSGDYSPRELKGVIAECGMFLGSRMHSNIGALSTHVPTVALSYSHKTLGIMESIGMSDYVLEGDKLTKEIIISTIDEAYRNKTSIRKRLEKVIPKIQESSRQNISNMADIIECSDE